MAKKTRTIAIYGSANQGIDHVRFAGVVRYCQENAGFVVRDILDGLSRAELQKRTGAPLTFAPDCRILAPPPLPDAE